MGDQPDVGGAAVAARLTDVKSGAVFPLRGDRAVAGRSDECDIVLPDSAVSRKHALFERTPGGWRVTDLGARTGIDVHGQRIAAPTVLPQGATLRIGRLDLRFEFDEKIVEAPVKPATPGLPKLPPDALVGTRLGEVEIRALIGIGGMGRVYHGFQTRLQRDVAVKVLAPELAKSPERVAGFIKEARSAARLVHSGIVTVLDAGEDRGHPYFLMELMDAGALDERMAKLPGGRLPWKEAFPALQSAAHGLAYLHREGYIHRDLKPGNLLARTTGEVKIADLGIALHMVEAASASRKGTALYAAPEMLRGAPPSPATDLYSLGATFHHILTGRPVFEGSDRNELLRRTAEGHRPRVLQRAPDVPPWLATIVDRLTSPKPEERFASAAELAAALDEKDVRRKARAMGIAAPPAEYVERTPVAAADRRPLIAVGVALAAGAVLWMLRGPLFGIGRDDPAAVVTPATGGTPSTTPANPGEPPGFDTPDDLARAAITSGDALLAEGKVVAALEGMLGWIREHTPGPHHEEDVAPITLDLCRRWVRTRAAEHREALDRELLGDQVLLVEALRTGLPARSEGALQADLGAVLAAADRAAAIEKLVPALRSSAFRRRAGGLAERLRRVGSTWKRLVQAAADGTLIHAVDEYRGIPGQPAAAVFRVSQSVAPNESGITFEPADGARGPRLTVAWKDLGAQALAASFVVPYVDRLPAAFRADLAQLFAEASCVDGAVGCFTGVENDERSRAARAEVEAIRLLHDLSAMAPDAPGLAERMARWRESHRRTDAYLRLVAGPATPELSLSDADLSVYFGSD